MQHILQHVYYLGDNFRHNSALGCLYDIIYIMDSNKNNNIIDFLFAIKYFLVFENIIKLSGGNKKCTNASL